jgi:hypothetical protein
VAIASECRALDDQLLGADHVFETVAIVRGFVAGRSPAAKRVKLVDAAADAVLRKEELESRANSSSGRRPPSTAAK